MSNVAEELAASEANQRPLSVKLEQGENVMEGAGDDISTVPSKYPNKPNQKIIQVVQNGIMRSLWISEKSPVFREILQLAVKTNGGHIRGLKFCIIRMGEREQTKMSLKKGGA